MIREDYEMRVHRLTAVLKGADLDLRCWPRLILLNRSRTSQVLG